jgi:hypothetical protein
VRRRREDVEHDAAAGAEPNVSRRRRTCLDREHARVLRVEVRDVAARARAEVGRAPKAEVRRALQREAVRSRRRHRVREHRRGGREMLLLSSGAITRSPGLYTPAPDILDMPNDAGTTVAGLSVTSCSSGTRGRTGTATLRDVVPASLRCTAATASDDTPAGTLVEIVIGVPHAAAPSAFR